MKRRLALLLALSLTFASFPVTGAAAAEAETPAAVEETADETADGNQAEIEAVKENEDAGIAGSGEEAASTDETAVEGGEEAVIEEAAPEEVEEAASAATTSAEIAAVEEPVAVDPNTVTEQAQLEKIADGWYENNTVYYKNGVKVTGLRILTFEGTARTFFFDANGKKKTGWVTIDDKGTVCYFADSRMPSLPAGAMVTGFKKIGNYWFYMADSAYASAHNVPRGKQMTGWQYINNGTYYFKPGTGSYPTGAAYVGWKSINGNLYYFADSNFPSAHEGKMLTGWKTMTNGKTFFFADSKYTSQPRGTLVKGLAKIGNNYYLFNSNGIQVKGWTTYDGRVAYYDSNNGKATKGWHAKGSSWYWTYETGLARVGWIKLGNYLYYLNPARGGLMATGSVLMESGKLMFFDANGCRATTKGWKTLGAYTYYTYADGTCARNTTIEGVKLDSMGRSTMTAMDRKAQGYSSDTNYLILVDKTKYKVCVYKGRKNEWVKLKEWDCTHGGSDTPNGTWKLDDHVTKRDATWGWADFDFSSAAFACHISAGNYFHTILFEKGTRGNPYNQPWNIIDSQLRTNYSHGCIRLEIGNAEWVCDNIPFGTKVVIYNS